MIGLYLLITKQLEKDNTIKFGMSMRIEYRWIDYLVIFGDSKYIYYYECLDNLTRCEILIIENEILELYKDDRNTFYQTEYLYYKDYNLIHQTIIEVLNKHNIKYIVHETHNFEREYYDNKPETFEYNFKPSNVIKPKEHQQEVLLKINEFYKYNNIGKLIHCCGLGKSLLGILIVHKLNYKNVVIGVPNIYLQKQMKNEILKIFTNHENILYIGGTTDKNDDIIIKSTTDPTIIYQFINKHSNECKFIITTYDSCHYLLNYSSQQEHIRPKDYSSIHDFYFDFKIGDEAHHLVGSELDKTKDSFHNIKSYKTLYMTATEKIIENNRTHKIIYSMDDEIKFGKIIDVKTINWAIEHKKITDYNLIILKNTEDEINNIINYCSIQEHIKNYKELFLAAFMSLKSIEKYNDLTHILIYTNKTEHSELVKKYIDIILDLDIININKSNYYNNALHSNSKEKLYDIKLLDNTIQEGEITKFKKASWGIISSVYIFGEGFDCPKLNGVVFGENMYSDIRIIQSTLRPNRLDSDFPDKKAYVIIPYIDTEDFIIDNDSFDKCRKIIAKIRNVDEKIEQKINVLSLNKSSYKLNDNTKENIRYYNIIENKNELTKIMLRLRYSHALDSLNTPEQDEYNYVKQLNTELNIQSKEEYVLTKNKHKNYIENPEEYFKSFGIWSNWYDFIGSNIDNFIQDKHEWVKFCKNKNVKSLDDYNELCKLNNNVPKNPNEFYKDFSNILKELNITKNRRL